MSIKEYKERTDDNSSTGPNEAVRVATLYYYNIFLIDNNTPKWKAPPHPTFLSAKGGRKRKRYHVVWTNYHEIYIGK